MNGTGFHIDPQLRAEFVDEALDDLDSLNERFLQLEQQPQRLELVEAIFRVAHSIKGNAAFFGLHAIKNLAHGLEDLLDEIRQKKILCSRTVIDTLLQGRDRLALLFQAIRDNSRVDQDPTAEQELLNRFSTAGREQPTPDSMAAELLTILREAHQHSDLPELARALELVQLLHNVEVDEPENGSLQSNHLEADRLARLNALLCDSDPAPLSEESTKKLIGILDHLAEALTPEQSETIRSIQQDAALLHQAVGLDSPLRKDIHKKIQKVLHAQPSAKPITPENPLEKQQQPARTMRISESSIDAFLGFVGDLIVIGDMYDHLQASALRQDVAEEFRGELRVVTNSFHELSDQLQESLMAIRRVPIRGLIQRLPRIIREIANQHGKDISVAIQGDDLEIDKSHVDLLEAPLMHLARNSADHGIKTPTERQQAGKTPRGTVSIDCQATDEELIICISDDGQGIDRECLLAKARERGLVEDQAEWHDQAIDNLIFLPGLSTATTVTDISGRGVGMDAVKTDLDQAGGSIAVRSEPGVGTRFVIRLPQAITTRISRGLIVSADGLPYVLPLDRLQVCFRPEQEQLVHAMDGQPTVVDGNGHHLPVLPLARTLGRDCPETNPAEQGCLAVVQGQHSRLALHVNELLGVRQIVLKDCDGLHSRRQLYQGAALLGDGSVAMVLDIDRLEAITCAPA